MTKALLLLSKFVQKLKAEYKRTRECRPEDLTLGLPNPDMKLGNFSSVLNCNTSDNKTITLSYSQYNYTVEYVFVGETPEVTGDGWLSEISIKTNQGTEVLHIKFKQQGHTFNVDRINIAALKNDFYCLFAHQALDVDFTNYGQIANDGHWRHICPKPEDLQRYERIIEQLSQIGIRFEDLRNIPIDGINARIVLSNRFIDMLEYNVLGFSSLFKQLNGISKSETRDVMMRTKKNRVIAYGKHLSELLEDFEQSRFETFLDYYLDKENNYQGFRYHDFNTSSLFNVFEKLFDNECLDPEYDLLETTLHECYNTDTPLPFDQTDFFPIFKDYLTKWMRATIMPSELVENHFHYVNSDRADIRRVYSDSPGDIFGQLLKQNLKAQRAFESKLLEQEEDDSYTFNTDIFLNHWIKKFGIGKGLDIHTTAEGAGLVAKIQQDYPFDKGMLLADKGYGITQLISVLLEIQTAIYTSYNSKNTIPSTIVIEEPEIHLHPKYQSLLAEMFLDAYRRANIHFIIETHSEYLIRRFMTLVLLKKQGQTGVDRENISMYYLFSPTEQPAGEPQVKKIGIREDGRLEDSFGSGFFDESEKLILDLMQIKIYER